MPGLRVFEVWVSRSRRRWALLLAGLTAMSSQAQPSRAAAPGESASGDRAIRQGRIPFDVARITCHESDRYLIIERQLQDRLGADLLVKYKPHAQTKYACHYAPEAGDFEIRNEWADYFGGLIDQLLLLDSSSGPGPSGLTIWELDKRQKVFVGTWHDREASPPGSLVYWLETGAATPLNCPELASLEAQGLGAAIETRVMLDLSTFEIRRTPETRCSARQ